MKYLDRRLLTKIKTLCNLLKNTITIILLKRDDIIIVNAYITMHDKVLEHQNYGDDLNYYLLKEITLKRIFSFNNFLHVTKCKNILFIGSIIETLTNKDSIIWGSGAIFGGNTPMKAKPKQVLAVRGPLTRQYLISKGIDCPETYGDPALLLPRIYRPNTSKKYKLGIIPHWVDLLNEFVLELTSNEKDSVHLIDLKHYKHWHDVINEVTECEFIISSSLHGIIIADAYFVPNLWVEFSDKIIGNGFKFRDYFASVKRDVDKPIIINSSIDIDHILQFKHDWTPIKIDLTNFVSASPFKLNFNY